MNPSNPDWYDALHGEPLKTKRFTSELSAQILAQARKPAHNRLLRLRRLSIAGAIAVCLVGGIMLVSMQGLLMKPLGQITGTSPISAGGAPQVSVIDPAIAAPAVYEEETIAPDGNKVPALLHISPTDGEWQKLINESYPNLTGEIMYRESVVDDRMFIFSRKVNKAADYMGVTLITDEFEWTNKGWTRASRFTYSPHENLEQSIDDDLLISWYGPDLIANDSTTTITMFSGLVINPSITQIRVTKNEEHVYWARILPSDDGLTYFFVALPPGERGVYELEGLDADGQLITNERYMYY